MKSGTYKNLAKVNVALPGYVVKVVHKLRDHGFEAFVVGGGVRDSVLGRPVKDWDVATIAKPNDIMGLFSRAIPTGIQHGTVTVIMDQQPVEITTYRVERGYKDHRRPDEVFFVDHIEEDLQRRDFTMNAVAYDPTRKAFVDPTGGLGDIGKKCIRAVGEPVQRFGEDALRLMRAARFAAQLGFKIDPKTINGMRACADQIQFIASERIREEIDRTLCSAQPALGMKLLADASVLQHVLPELVDDLSNILYDLATAARLDVAPHLRWSVILTSLDVSAASRVLKRLRVSNELMHAVLHLLAHRRVDWDDVFDEPSIRRWILQVGKANALDVLQLAEILAARKKSLSAKKLLNLRKSIVRQLNGHMVIDTADLAVSGRDIMRICGIDSGKQVGQILASLVHELTENPTLNEKEKLEQLLVEKWRVDLG